jgi:hypothetical protein
MNSWHDIWRFPFWGLKLASLRHADPRAEWKSPSITLMNSIKQLKSVAMIYILPVPVKALRMPVRPSGKPANNNI